MQNSFFYSSFPKQSDEYPSGFVIPPLILPNNFQPPFIQRKIENLPTQTFIEPSAFLNFQPQDSFFPNFDENYNPNIAPLEYRSNEHLTNPEITIDSDFMTKSKEYAMDYFQTCRSKGPSFCLGKSKKESLDFFSPSIDILSYFEKNESNTGLATDPKTLESTADDFITNRSNSPQRSSPRILPYDRKDSQEMLGYSDIGAFAFENPTLCHNSFDACSPVKKGRTITKSASLAVQKAKTTTRKKRKIEKSNDLWVKEENGELLSSNLKLIKSKSEFYNDTVNMETLSLPNMKNPFTLINNPTFCGMLQESTDNRQSMETTGICEKIDKEKDDKSTDISSSMSVQPKHEDSPQGFKFSLGILPSNNPAQTSNLPPCDFLTKMIDIEPLKDNNTQANKDHGLIGKRIGTLSIEERKAKIEKYLEKRKQRTWNKKISYDCRKRVADSRLRIKGRFVTKSQAFSILETDGVPFDPNTITLDEIKEYLTKKFGESHKIHDSEKRRFFEGEDSFIFEKKDEDRDEDIQENDRDFYFEMKEELLLSPLRFSDGKVSFPYE